MKWQTGTSPIALPEARAMVAVALKYVAGGCHFTELIGAAMECEFWTRTHDVHPAIRELAVEWARLGDQVWNEWNQYGQSLPEERFKARVAADLGISEEPCTC